MTAHTHNFVNLQEISLKSATLKLFSDILAPQIEHCLLHDDKWDEYTDGLELFGLYVMNTWIERRNGKDPLYKPEVWNQFETVKEGGPETNNQLESYNRTFNNLAGNKPNVWSMLSLVKSQEADTRRCFLSNAVGRDLTSNSGRRQASKDAKERIKWLIDHFRTTPEKEYILTMAHELMKSYSSGNLH